MLTPRTNFGIQTNGVDPDQTAPQTGSTLFATETFKSGIADDTADAIYSGLAAGELIIHVNMKICISR